MLVFLIPGAAVETYAADEVYDVVITGGRIMDPESGLDAVRNIGIMGGKIRMISEAPQQGKQTIDAKGLVVAPGFIDLHQHGQDVRNYRYKARDGVTTSLELEVGTDDVDKWSADREGKTLVNFGVSIGHIPVRMKVMHDPATFLPSGDAAHRAAVPEELVEIKKAMAEDCGEGLWPWEWASTTPRRPRTARLSICFISRPKAALRSMCICVTWECRSRPRALPRSRRSLPQRPQPVRRCMSCTSPAWACATRRG